MDPIQPKFFSASFALEYQGATLALRGLVSEKGITTIQIPSGLSDAWKEALGKIVKVRIDEVELEGQLLQQFVQHGSFFEVKFLAPNEVVAAYLQQRVATEGSAPGWRRKFPRIPVKGFDDPELPVPNLCMVRFIGQEIFVNVMNFTLGGIRIETLTDVLGELRVGSVVHFDLITSTGDVLTNLNAEVRNIATHETERKTGPLITRSFGLRFVELDPVNERKYRDLIRDYCLILQKRFPKDP